MEMRERSIKKDFKCKLRDTFCDCGVKVKQVIYNCWHSYA